MGKEKCDICYVIFISLAKILAHMSILWVSGIQKGIWYLSESRQLPLFKYLALQQKSDVKMVLPDILKHILMIILSKNV